MRYRAPDPVIGQNRILIPGFILLLTHLSIQQYQYKFLQGFPIICECFKVLLLIFILLKIKCIKCIFIIINEAVILYVHPSVKYNQENVPVPVSVPIPVIIIDVQACVNSRTVEPTLSSSTPPTRYKQILVRPFIEFLAISPGIESNPSGRKP